MKQEYILAENPKIRVTGTSERVFLESAPYFCTTLEGSWRTWLAAYAKGETAPMPPFNFSLLTPFSKKVLSALLKLLPGQTTTYSSLLEDRRYARAVGLACHHNPYPLFIPCHRVVSLKGIGGFRFDSCLKQSLLTFEKNLLLP